MEQLPNNCRVGKFTVLPKNWNTAKASLKEKWLVAYRFYDDNLKKVKQIKHECFSTIATLKERQFAVKTLIDTELNELRKNNYNPILNDYTEKEADKSITMVDESTPFIAALEFALTKDETSEKNKSENRRYLSHITKAITDVRFDMLAIGEVRLKHLLTIFEKLKENKKTWSDDMHNRHRKTLGKIFSILEKYDAVLKNFAYKLEIKTVITEKREVLTDDECLLVYKFLKENYYTFWRYALIFFQSGCRSTELLRVQAMDVDLAKREFDMIVYKGGKPRRETRAITAPALPLWIEIMNEAADKKQFLFGNHLMPSNNPNDTHRITGRWRKHVKNKLGIKADFYSLKHLYLDRLAEIGGEKAAQQAAAHKDVRVTLDHYLVNEERRKLERRKQQVVNFV